MTALGPNGERVTSRSSRGLLEICCNTCYNDAMNKHITISSAKITTIGNSVGITLPKEVLALLHVSKGDTLCFTETPEGVLLTPYNKEFADMMEAAETVMREDRDVLRILAK